METRSSSGLDQFCSLLVERPGLTLLDLAGASQSTVAFITNLGHRIYSDDLLLQMDRCFGDGDFYENQSDSQKVAQFLDTALDYPAQHFDGALVWDTLEFLSGPLLETVVRRLNHMLRPGSYLLALFHAEERAETIPTYSRNAFSKRRDGLHSQNPVERRQIFVKRPQAANPFRLEVHFLNLPQEEGSFLGGKAQVGEIGIV